MHTPRAGLARLNMAEPPVTFIVRCKNKRATIESTFASIRRQTVPAEIVVVDSGSHDGTLAVAREWADVVLEMRPDEFTFGRSLNLGASAASGEIHAALSAHAVLPAPDWLARVLGISRTNVSGGHPAAAARPMDRHCSNRSTKASRNGRQGGASRTRRPHGGRGCGKSIASTSA